MQRLFLLVAVMLLSGCLTAPPKEAARPTLMPRAQSYKDLTHLPAPTGKIFVSVYNIQDETGQFKPYPASNFSTAVPQSATAMLVTALKDSRWFIPLERQGAYSALFDHGLASKSDQRFASIRSTGNLTFSTAF